MLPTGPPPGAAICVPHNTSALQVRGSGIRDAYTDGQAFSPLDEGAVVPAGLEPSISALKELRPDRLDEGTL